MSEEQEADVTAREPAPGAQSATAFVLDVARALHAYGMPAHRLETLLEAVGDRLGVPSQFFATPTSIFAAFGEPPDQRTYLVTPVAGEVDLGRLADLDELVQEVADGRVDPAEGSRRVRAALALAPRYPTPLRLVAHALLAGSAALVLGGGVAECAVAALVGCFVGVLDLFSGRVAAKPTSSEDRHEGYALSRLQPAIGAFVAAAAAGLATLRWPELVTSTVGVAGIIMLVPGLTLTVAMTEVATGHLVSGTARLSKAMLTFLLLGFGAALGGELAGLVPGVSAGGAPGGEAVWVPWVSVAVFIPCLVVLLGARARDTLYIAPACVVSYAMGVVGAALLGPEVGAGLATLALGLVANAFARWKRRPAQLLLVPGVLLLVPGSLGFRSISSFLADEVLTAVATAFDVALVAVALVAGLLVAALALPPRRAL